MIKKYPFSSLQPRPTKRQLAHDILNELIVAYFRAADGHINAGALWFDMRAKGHAISISSFYNRLKELVNLDVIEKKSDGYNKYVYKFIKKEDSAR